MRELRPACPPGYKKCSSPLRVDFVESNGNQTRVAMNPDTSAMAVLVADEFDLVRDGLRFLLSSRPGWQICAEAINGREAVEKAIQFRPDINGLDGPLKEALKRN